MFLADDAATAALGARLAEWSRTRPGGVIFLVGDLGAGKTTLARGFLRTLGATGALRSPTYTLIEPYELPGRTVVHADLYRLNDPLELEQLGLADYSPRDTWWLIEWPERGQGMLPPADLVVQLAMAGDGREATLAGPSSGHLK